MLLFVCWCAGKDTFTTVLGFILVAPPGASLFSHHHYFLVSLMATVHLTTLQIIR